MDFGNLADSHKAAANHATDLAKNVVPVIAARFFSRRQLSPHPIFAAMTENGPMNGLVSPVR
jgi:hypothetical protein